MAKPNKKGGKGPKGPRGSSFDENALTNLTSKLDQSLAKGSDHKRKQPPTNNDSANQDRKRQRNSSKGPPNKSPKGAKGGPSKPSPAKGGKGAGKSLLDEIRALGGDEEDLALIEDIESSDEEVVKAGDAPLDKKLKAELAAFSKNLGFDDHQPSEASDSEDGADQEEEEDDQEEEDVEEENDENEQEDEEKAFESERQAHRHAENMVCSYYPSLFA